MSSLMYGPGTKESARCNHAKALLMLSRDTGKALQLCMRTASNRLMESFVFLFLSFFFF